MDTDSESSDEDEETGEKMLMEDEEHNSALMEAIKKGRYRQTKLMLEAQSGVNAREENTGQTPLVICCTHLHEAKLRSKFVELLLDAGADPNLCDLRGMSAIMHAAILGQVETVLILLNHPGTDLELQDLDGNTALMYAACFGHSDIVALLLGQMGRLRQVLHLSQRNHGGFTALQLAERNGHERVVLELGGERISKSPKFPKSFGEFPNPQQLNGGPTPESPMLSSFPIRWRRQTIAGKQRRDAISNVHESAIDDDSDRTLPRLAWAKMNDGGGVDLRWSVPVPVAICDDRNTVTSARSSNESCDSITPTCNSTSNSEFQKVLNLLDAAIDGDDDRSTSRNSRVYQDNEAVSRSYQVVNRGYFPPIRPVRTTVLPPLINATSRYRGVPDFRNKRLPGIPPHFSPL